MQLAAWEKEFAPQLAHAIVDRAEGVLLWVQIVVRLLLKGINNHDTIPQLWLRLRSFPTELHGLYKTILLQIEPIYLDWASRAFQLMLATPHFSSISFKRGMAESSADILGEEGKGMEECPLTLIVFSFALDEVEKLDCGKIRTISYLSSRLRDTQIHLTARCAGLLEVRNLNDTTDPRAPFQLIRWMHRTARDFVCESKIWTVTIDDCFPEPSI